jgi:uroporphyrin-III C-methyltransferase/precorrin-2 dehydrogenase/sirohydrochlorin ferrochelatase
VNYYPVFLDLRGARILFVGGTEAIVAKLRLALKTVSELVVVSAEADEQIHQWASDGRLQWRAREFDIADLTGARMVYIATGVAQRDSELADLVRDAGILVNVVDTPDLCNFITPALVDRDPLVIAIGTEGAAPVLARRIKVDLEERLSPQLGGLVAAAAVLRERVSIDLPSKVRRAIWGRFFSPDGEAALANGTLESHFQAALSAREDPRVGRVVVIGTGPGDAELLTLKARKALHEADIVLHEPGVSREILELARREAKVVASSNVDAALAPDFQAEVAEGALLVFLCMGDGVAQGAAHPQLEFFPGVCAHIPVRKGVA